MMFHSGRQLESISSTSTCQDLEQLLFRDRTRAVLVEDPESLHGKEGGTARVQLNPWHRYHSRRVHLDDRQPTPHLSNSHKTAGGPTRKTNAKERRRERERDSKRDRPRGDSALKPLQPSKSYQAYDDNGIT